MEKAQAEFKQKGVAGLVEQGTKEYREDVRKTKVIMRHSVLTSATSTPGRMADATMR